MSDAPGSGSYEICSVCYWEDDGVQFRDSSYRGGANEASLTEARAAFNSIAVSERRFQNHVRPPLPEEAPRYDWDSDPCGLAASAQSGGNGV